MLGMTRMPAKGLGMLDIKRTFLALDQAPQAQHMYTSELASIADQIREGTAEIQIGRANIEDLGVILSLIDEAKTWLSTKGTNQWSTDWLDQDGRGRSARVEISVKEEATWLVWFVSQHEKIPMATVTIEKNANPDVWTDPGTADKPAAYLSRLITARRFSGLRIGAALIDWACAYVAREYRAKFIRIDVWTDNYALHDYYIKQGFRPCGLCPNETYPSRALFQRATSGTPAWMDVRHTSMDGGSSDLETPAHTRLQPEGDLSAPQPWPATVEAPPQRN
jgi:GNAT superfamily N-acetyltransferase